jgi:hypothetical protein
MLIIGRFVFDRARNLYSSSFVIVARTFDPTPIVLKTKCTYNFVEKLPFLHSHFGRKSTTIADADLKNSSQDLN